MKLLLRLAALVLLTVSTALANPLGPQPTLVMPIYFEQPQPPSEVRALVNEADRLLRLNSAGMTWLEPLYVPAYHPQHPAEAYRGTEGMRRLRQEALEHLPAIPQLRRYRRQVVVAPAEFPEQASIGTYGYELMKCPQDEFYASTALVRHPGSCADCARILLHELGHNFGFCHEENSAMDGHREGDLFSAADRRSVGWP